MVVPWYLYAGFILFVVAMLLVDLKFFHAEEHDPKPKESGVWVVVWVSLALIFGIVVYFWKGGTSAAEFFAGYLIEYSLSVDNMFVFVLIFTYFKVPFRYQHQVLFYGILGAMVFRGIFIALGVTLIERFEWVIYIFGAFLIITAFRMAFGDEEVHPEDNPILKWAQRRLRTTPRYYGQKLFVVEAGKRLATPLFIVLLFVEMTDIVFAVDSIPAIFAVTRDPFIVLTSNVFAILGLRALYFLLADVIDRFHLLKYGLAIILAFVGTKMLLEAIHFEIPILVSLLVIVLVLAATVILSIVFPPHHEGSDAPAPAPGSDDGVGPSLDGADENASSGGDPRSGTRPR